MGRSRLAWAAGLRSRLLSASTRCRCVVMPVPRRPRLIFCWTQSVETYSKKTGARVGETQAKPVIEYLVFQKRMWYDSPWVIRDRLYEGLDSRFGLPNA